MHFHFPHLNSCFQIILNFHALAVFNLLFDALVAFCIARVWFHVLVLVAACEISNILQVHFPFLFTVAMTSSNLCVVHRRGEFFIAAEPDDTIDNVKAKIQAQEGIPSDQQRLTFYGQTLLGTTRLRDHGVLVDINRRTLWLQDLGEEEVDEEEEEEEGGGDDDDDNNDDNDGDGGSDDHEL